MTNCQNLSEILVDLAVGDLPAAEAVEVHAHAAACEPCRTLLAREMALVEALRNQPPVPAFQVQEPALPRAAIVALHAEYHARRPDSRRPDSRRPDSRRHWGANARLAAAVALVSAAGLLWAVRLGGGFDGVGNTASVNDVAPAAVPVAIHTILASDGTIPPADDHFLALTAGIEAVVMRRPAQDRCANGLCASGR